MMAFALTMPSLFTHMLIKFSVMGNAPWLKGVSGITMPTSIYLLMANIGPTNISVRVYLATFSQVTSSPTFSITVINNIRIYHSFCSIFLPPGCPHLPAVALSPIRRPVLQTENCFCKLIKYKCMLTQTCFQINTYDVIFLFLFFSFFRFFKLVL